MCAKLTNYVSKQFMMDGKFNLVMTVRIKIFEFRYLHLLIIQNQNNIALEEYSMMIEIHVYIPHFVLWYRL